jgi:hypothetical protein
MGKRRQSSKYFAEEDFLGFLRDEHESTLATLEILFDRKLTARLMKLSRTIDADVAAGKLLTTSDVFRQMIRRADDKSASGDL